MVRYNATKLWVQSLPDFKIEKKVTENENNSTESSEENAIEHEYTRIYQKKPAHKYLFEWRCTCISNSTTQPSEEDIKAYQSVRCDNNEKSKTYYNNKDNFKERGFKTEEQERSYNFEKSREHDKNKDYIYRNNKYEKHRKEKAKEDQCCRPGIGTSNPSAQQARLTKLPQSKVKQIRNLTADKLNNVASKEQVLENDRAFEKKTVEKIVEYRTCTYHQTLETNKDKSCINKNVEKKCCKHKDSQCCKNSNIKRVLSAEHPNDKNGLVAHTQLVKNTTVNQMESSVSTRSLGEQTQCCNCNICNKKHLKKGKVNEIIEVKEKPQKIELSASMIKAVTNHKQFQTNTKQKSNTKQVTKQCHCTSLNALKNSGQNNNHIQNKSVVNEKLSYICRYHSKIFKPNRITKSDSMQVLCSASCANEVWTPTKDSILVNQSLIDNLEEQYEILKEKYETLNEVKHNCIKCKQSLILQMLLLKRKLKIIKYPKDQSQRKYICEKHKAMRYEISKGRVLNCHTDDEIKRKSSDYVTE